jgi:hypothetical protein
MELFETVLEGMHHWLIHDRDMDFNGLLALLATVPGASLEKEYLFGEMGVRVTKGGDELFLNTDSMAEGIHFKCPENMPRSALLCEVLAKLESHVPPEKPS